LPVWWPVGIGRNARILDVGSGAGHLLYHLMGLGFRNLQGVDPFITRDVQIPGGPVIHKAEIAAIKGEFDVIVMNHSLEHMPKPHAVFHELERLLAPDGWLVIRTPVATGAVWKRYGVDWVQLDAPRHRFIHTPRSIGVLAQGADLSVESVVYDSTEFQFWGSEQYRLDIPLEDARSYKRSPSSSPFSVSQIADFARWARDMNRSGEGDQACFYLRPGVLSAAG